MNQNLKLDKKIRKLFKQNPVLKLLSPLLLSSNKLKINSKSINEIFEQHHYELPSTFFQPGKPMNILFLTRFLHQIKYYQLLYYLFMTKKIDIILFYKSQISQSIFKMFSRFKFNITGLSFYHCKIHKLEISQLAKLETQALQHFCLQSDKVTNNLIKSLFKIKMPNIISFRLSNLNITNDVIKIFIKQPKKYQQLSIQAENKQSNYLIFKYFPRMLSIPFTKIYLSIPNDNRNSQFVYIHHLVKIIYNKCITKPHFSFNFGTTHEKFLLEYGLSHRFFAQVLKIYILQCQQTVIKQ